MKKSVSVVMKTSLVVVGVIAMAIGVAVFAPTPSYAWGGHGGFHGGFHDGGFRHGGFHHGGVRTDIFLGFGVDPFWPVWWGPPAYAYAPPIVVEQQPPVYIEQPAPGAYWYYCPSAKAYYPYVRSCSNGWVQVPAQPQ